MRSSISSLLRMHGQKRLGVKDEITERILGFDYATETPGLGLKFLDTQKFTGETGEFWAEYNILFEVLKYKDSDPIFLSYVFGLVEKAMLMFKDLGEFDSMGIQEVECGDSDYYYILIYLLK